MNHKTEYKSSIIWINKKKVFLPSLINWTLEKVLNTIKSQKIKSVKKNWSVQFTIIKHVKRNEFVKEKI